MYVHTYVCTHACTVCMYVYVHMYVRMYRLTVASSDYSHGQAYPKNVYNCTPKIHTYIHTYTWHKGNTRCLTTSMCAHTYFSKATNYVHTYVHTYMKATLFNLIEMLPANSLEPPPHRQEHLQDPLSEGRCCPACFLLETANPRRCCSGHSQLRTSPRLP